MSVLEINKGEVVSYTKRMKERHVLVDIDDRVYPVLRLDSADNFKCTADDNCKGLSARIVHETLKELQEKYLNKSMMAYIDDEPKTYVLRSVYLGIDSIIFIAHPQPK